MLQASSKPGVMAADNVHHHARYQQKKVRYPENQSYWLGFLRRMSS